MTALRAALAAGFLAALIAAYFYGVGVGKDSRDADNAAEIARQDEKILVQQERIGALGEKAATREIERHTTVREINRDVPTIIDRPVYGNVCVDADGVRLLDRAQAAANGEGGPGAAGGPARAAGDAEAR
jgi:hypothetical protein